MTIGSTMLAVGVKVTYQRLLEIKKKYDPTFKIEHIDDYSAEALEDIVFDCDYRLLNPSLCTHVNKEGIKCQQIAVTNDLTDRCRNHRISEPTNKIEFLDYSLRTFKFPHDFNKEPAHENDCDEIMNREMVIGIYIDCVDSYYVEKTEHRTPCGPIPITNFTEAFKKIQDELTKYEIDGTPMIHAVPDDCACCS